MIDSNGGEYSNTVMKAAFDVRIRSTVVFFT